MTNNTKLNPSTAHLSPAHLSDEAIDDILIGESSPESDAHLALCPVCRSNVEEFRSEMQLFNQTSLAWVESRGESRPAAAVRATPLWKLSTAFFAPASMALAAVLLLAVKLPLWNHNPHAVRSSASAATALSQDSDAQIAQDNDLLRSVDMALNSEDASPLAEFSLPGRIHRAPKATPARARKPRAESRNR